MSTQEIDLVDWLKERYENIKKSIVDHFDEYTLSKQKVAHHISLTLTLIISLLIRLFPTFKGWEPTIKAFDPYMQLRSAEYILEHGLLSFFYWHDYYSWYPYGRPMGISMYIAVPLAIILIYKVGLFLGFNMTLKVAAYLVPVVFGVIAVYFMYLLGKELISPRAGLIAALLMSVAPAFLTRSIAGFVDNESVGVLFTIMTLYFFSRSILRDSNRSGIFAGLSMFLLGSSWGAFRFTYDLLAVIAMVFVISGKFSPRFFKTYLYTLSVSVYFMIGIPRIGGSFVMGTEGLAPIGMIVFLILISVLQNVSKDLHPDTFRRIIVTGFMSITILMTIILIILNAVDSVDSIGSKFISVILPTERNDLPLIDSVSEHLPMAWGNLYANVSTLVFFIPLGIYYGIRKPTEKNLIILTFGIITILFSGSMVRLMLLLAPAAILLTALAIDSLLIPYAYVAHGRIKLSKTTMTLPSITGQNSALTYFIVYCLILVMLGTSINRADRIANPELTPSLSESGSPNDAVTDWLDAFTWMQEHTSYEAWAADNLYSGLGSGQPPVMLSWWDYGYYITNQGGTVTLADNATSNSTQIGVVGTMLMWNTTAALNLMYLYNVKYVLVYPAGGALSFGSDIGKSTWMIKISEQYTPEFGVREDDYFSDTENQYQAPYFDSVLWNLMSYRSSNMDTASGAPFTNDPRLEQLLPNYQEQMGGPDEPDLVYFREAWRSRGIDLQNPYQFPIIRIFEVNYPDDILQRVRDFQDTMANVYAAIAAENAAEEGE